MTTDLAESADIPRCDMKKLTSALLALAAALLCACGAPAVTVAATEPPAAAAEPSATAATAAPSVAVLDFYKTTETLSEEREGTTLCTVKYPALALSDEDAAAYPALAAALASLNRDGAANSTAAYGQLLSAAASDYDRRAAAESAAAAPDAADGSAVTPFEMFYRYDDLTLPRADSRAVSILYSMTGFSGGVHGSYYYYSTNLDTATGRALSVGDVVVSMPQLRAALEAALREKYPDAGFELMEDALNGYFADPASLTWTLDYQGLSFFFSPGELSDFDDGKMSCSIRFDAYPGMFSGYYTAVPLSYAVPFTQWRCMDYDLNGDGAEDDIHIDCVYADDGVNIEKLTIGVNGREYTANTPMTDCAAYTVCVGGGAKSVLIISAQNLTGYGYMSVYRLDRTGASLVGMLYDSSLYAAGYATACPGVPLLTDPDSFVLGTRIQYLGTLTGIKTYSLGEDGMPASGDAYYQLSGAQPLTLKSQLVTATIDAAGSGTFAAETLSPGTRLSFLRSDGAGAVDMHTDDGVYCRLYVSGKPGSQRVNGMPVEDVFSGIVY